MSIETALRKCRETYIGPGPCYLPEYLEARYLYHRLLVARGMLDPKLAEKQP